MEEETTMTPEQELDQVIDSYNNGTTPEPQADTTPAPEPEASAEQPVQEQPVQPAPQTQQSPANAAFAEMRTKNDKLNKFVAAYAKLNNLDSADLDGMTNALEEKLTAQEASKNNVPPELWARFKQQEEMLNNIMKMDAERNFTSAFNSVRETYGLDDAKAAQFASELRDQKFNLQDLSKLPLYYKALHFDELVNARVEEALAKASSDSEYAAKHGATVQTSSGTLPGSDVGSGDDKADTMAAIMQGLSGLK